MNVALIPCFDRPEFLTLCLENICNAEGSGGVHYIFRIDHPGPNPSKELKEQQQQILQVISPFPHSHQLSFTPRTSYGLAKQSHSLLTGLIQAATKSDHLVYLIEDDVMIGRDFFQWHDRVHHDNDLFSSHGNLNINRSIPIEGNWEEYYLTSGDYGSIGTCMRKDTILGLIAPHANPRYFRSPISYVQKTFPHSALKKDQAEQDGLLRRIQVETGKPQAYPHTTEIDGLLYGPRCFHAGFYGKNRPKKYTGDLQQKIARLREIIYSEEGMRSFALAPGYYADSRPCALELPEWSTLRMKSLQGESSLAS